jgi:hypothetical protein
MKKVSAALLLIATAMLMSPPQAAAKKKKAPEPPLVLRYEATNPSLCIKILRDTSKQGFWATENVEGMLQNQCTYALSNVILVYDFVQGDGAKIGEVPAFLSYLQRGGTWKFTVPCSIVNKRLTITPRWIANRAE